MKRAFSRSVPVFLYIVNSCFAKYHYILEDLPL